MGTGPAVTWPKLSVEELPVVDLPATICLSTRESGIEDLVLERGTTLLRTAVCTF